MAKLCPHCGAKLPETGDAFCSECNNALDEPPAGSQQPGRPKSEAPLGTGEPSVWYATEGRMFRWLKFAWDDDRGVIDAMSGSVCFTGRGRTLQMARLRAAPLLVWVIPWGAVVSQQGVAGVASLLLGDTLVLLLAGAGAFNYLTLESPLTYLVLGLLNLFALAYWPIKWVRVDYVDEQGNPGRAYFTVGSALGRWAGGVRRLLERFGMGATWMRAVQGPLHLGGMTQDRSLNVGLIMTPRTRITKRVNRNGDVNDPATLRPMLTLEEFFEGNDVVGSMCANCTPTPTPREVYETLRRIRSRPEVADVRVQLQMFDDPEWPFSDIVWVITTAEPEDVKSWFDEDMAPDECWSGWYKDVQMERVEVQSDYQPVACWWD